MVLRQVIGNVFRRLRRERGITLRELAEQAQVSVPYLSEIERGRKEPSSEILAAIAGPRAVRPARRGAVRPRHRRAGHRAAAAADLVDPGGRIVAAAHRFVPWGVLDFRAGVRAGRLVSAPVAR